MFGNKARIEVHIINKLLRDSILRSVYSNYQGIHGLIKLLIKIKGIICIIINQTSKIY